jgi:diphthamide biosynthesis protein 7
MNTLKKYREIYANSCRYRIQVQTVLQPSALLDLRFHPHPSYGDMLAVVSSTGSLAVFKLDPESHPSRPLHSIATSGCEDLGEDVLFLQCNWYPANERLIGVTTSTGSARILQLGENWKITAYEELRIQNELEAWCIAFAPVQAPSEGSCTPTTVYSGGDDSTLRYTSISWNQTDAELLEAPFPAVTIKSHHNAGVTAILPLDILDTKSGRLVVTGSYDDHLRLFSIHDLHESFGAKRVQLLTDKDLGGGVWRLDLVETKVSQSRKKVRILVSCMHAGARIVDLECAKGDDWSCNVVARFEEHKSMNYGSDFVRGEAGLGMRCISTSFYDKLLCLWEFKPDPGSGNTI